LAVDPSRVSAFFWAVVLGLAFFSATQDIAIDAYTIELLDEKEMGPANGVRAAFVGAAAVMALFCLLSSRLPHARPDPVTPMPATPASRAIGRAIWTPLRQFFGYP